MKFNQWSKLRMMQGRKRLTSRNKAHMDDPHVEYIVQLPWCFIRDFLYMAEGADSPEELQRVMNKIQRRKVEDDRLFFVHVLVKDICN